MPDYIKMTVLNSHGDTEDLVSETLQEKATADYFSQCFAHNYHCSTEVSQITNGTGYVVFAYNVSYRLIRPNIDNRSKTGTFANWMFEGRRF